MNRNTTIYTYRFFLINSIVLLFVVFAIGLFAQSKTKLQKDKKKLEKEIQDMDRQLKETQKSTKTSTLQLFMLNQKISLREELIGAITSDITVLDHQIDNNLKEIAFLEKDLVKLKEEYAKMVYYTYKNHNSYNNLLLVLSSEDLFQAYKRLRYLKEYSDYQKKQADEIIQTKESLRVRIDQLNAQRIQKELLLKQNENEKIELAKEKLQKNEMIAELRSKEQDLKKQKRQKEASLAKLNDEINRIIQEEIRKQAEKRKRDREAKKKEGKNKKGQPAEEVSAKAITTYELTPEEQTLSNSFIGNKGKLPWPSETGSITSAWGRHPHPVFTELMVDNSGIDIGTNRSAPVRAVFDGKVTGVVNIMGTKAVIIRHGEYLTVYANLFTASVSTGQTIKTKQLIGTVATSANDGKTELHFEVRRGNTTLNPESWIKAR